MIYMLYVILQILLIGEENLPDFFWFQDANIDSLSLLLGLHNVQKTNVVEKFPLLL